MDHHGGLDPDSILFALHPRIHSLQAYCYVGQHHPGTPV
jgi:hypothetical protein